VLYVIACGGRPAGDLPAFVEEAQANGWEVCVIATPSALKFMDSTGLRVLLRARAAADEGRWEIGLRNVPPTIRRLFDMTGVHAALPAEMS